MNKSRELKSKNIGKGKILDRKCYGYTNDENGKLVPFEEVQAIHKERSNMKYNEYNIPIERKKTRHVGKENNT